MYKQFCKFRSEMKSRYENCLLSCDCPIKRPPVESIIPNIVFPAEKFTFPSCKRDSCSKLEKCTREDCYKREEYEIQSKFH